MSRFDPAVAGLTVDPNNKNGFKLPIHVDPSQESYHIVNLPAFANWLRASWQPACCCSCGAAVAGDNAVCGACLNAHTSVTASEAYADGRLYRPSSSDDADSIDD